MVGGAKINGIQTVTVTAGKEVEMTSTIQLVALYIPAT
jgi:hypothetical protein